MNSWISKTLQIILTITPFLLIAIFWDNIPERIPMQFGVDGTPNYYSSKLCIFLLPGFTVVTSLLLLLIPYIDPKKKADGISADIQTFSLIFATLFTGIFIFILLALLGKLSDGFTYIPGFIVFMFMIMGNFFGKLRPNYFIGIRTPWTLESETVWIKTHRLAGRIWVIASFITMFSFFFSNVEFKRIWFYAYIAVIAGVPIIYSFLLFRKMKKTEMNNSAK